MRPTRVIAGGVALTLLLAPAARAQQILVDRGIRAGGLWCFPIESSPDRYVYLPAGARLATGDSGGPEFSFIRYVINRPGPAEEATITAAGGGGVLHFLVLYDTPRATIDAAQRELRRLTENDKIVLRGPVVFSQGSYTLVSSILNPAEGSSTRQVLATGRAPVLEGNRLALSFDLEPERSTLLLESFQMQAPDVSLVFDMTFHGLNEAYDAELVVDWAEVRKSKSFAAGGSVYFVSADVKRSFDELLRDNAIRLRSSGSDSAMEALLDNVYGKLLELMFRPVTPDQVPKEKRGGLLDALSALVGAKGGPLSSRKTTGFGAHVGYQLKEMRSEGVSVLNFNHRSTVERHSFITFNIGDLYQRYGAEEGYFRTVNLDDPAFQQREVHVAVDGALLPELERAINSVTVTLRKRHASGAETLRELVLDHETVQRAARSLRVVYGWDRDDDRQDWLRYDYRTRWSFKGGGVHETEWTASDGPMIDLFAPYERRTIQLIGSAEALQQLGVRAAIVRLEYPFFGEKRREQVVVRPGPGKEEEALEITMPLGEYEYEYAVTWILENDRRVSVSGSDDTGVVFVDAPPEG